MKRSFSLLLFIVTLSYSSVFTQLRSPLVESGFSFNFEGFLTRRTYSVVDTVHNWQYGVGFTDRTIVNYSGTSYSDLTAELSVGFREKFMISTSIKPMRIAMTLKINLTDRGDYSSLFRNFACGGYIGGGVNFTDELFDLENDEIQDLGKFYAGLSFSTRKYLSETSSVEIMCNPTVSTGIYQIQTSYESEKYVCEFVTTELAMPVGVRFSKKKRATHFFTASVAVHAISPVEFADISEKCTYRSTPPVVALGYGIQIPTRRSKTAGEER